MHSFFTHRNNMSQFSDQDAANNNSGMARPRVWRRWLRAAVNNWKRRKMVAELQSMEDRLLKDIGIERSDIQRIGGGFDDRRHGMVLLAKPSRIASDDQNALKLVA
ncbi:DUF1127 domain-containing protein [Yoonia sp. MH D7]